MYKKLVHLKGGFMKSFKKIICILFIIMLLPTFLVACTIFKEDAKLDNQVQAGNNELLKLDGSWMVLSLEEVNDLLSQAKNEGSRASVLNSKGTPTQYSKADLLLIINQIKRNMINSTRLSFEFAYNGVSDKGVVGENLEYVYSEEGNCVYESWIVKEDGCAESEFAVYTITTENSQVSYTKSFWIPDEELGEGVGIEEFCANKFLFMTEDLDFSEIHIKEAIEYDGNLYISLNVEEMDGERDANEIFIVENGRVVKDELSFTEVEDGVENFFKITQVYNWDNDIDNSLLNRATNIPQDIEWQED